MDYLLNLAALVRGERPRTSPSEVYDSLGVYATLALAERMEAVAAEMAAMNAHLALLSQIDHQLGTLGEVLKGKSALGGT